MPFPENNGIYDVAIVGGGIAGAGIARDAALRGLKTILFEKSMFGCGTSSKSSKLIHGGIRYLETAWVELKKGRLTAAWKNFRFVFTSLKESRILSEIAPELVRPIPLLIPVFKNSGRNRWSVYAGCWLYFLLSSLSGKTKAPKILWSKEQVLKILPPIRPAGLKGGVIIWDHCTDDAELVKQTIFSAARAGAEAFENAKVTGYSFNGEKKIYEIRVEQNGRAQVHRARKLINAGGPWVDRIRALGRERTEDLILPVAGSHVSFKKFTPHSVILEAEDHRPFFVINLGEYSRVGTTERRHDDPDAVEPTEAEVDYLLRSLQKYFPGLNLDQSQIVEKDAGIRPLARPKKDGSSVHSISREHELFIGPTGVIHVIGVKLTDHRRAAEEVVDKITRRKSRTRRTPL